MRAPALALALLACVGAAVVLRLPWLDAVADRDVTVYATIGEHLGWSTLPYSELFDHKQPLVFPAYALLDALFGADMRGLRVTSALMAGVTAFLVWLVLLPLAGRARAALAAAITLVAGASTFVEGGDLNVEQLVLPFSTAAVLVPLALRERRGAWVPVLAGLLASVPALMKVSLLPALVVGLLPLLLCRPARVRTALLYAAGLVVPVLLVTLFFAVRGVLGDFVDANIVFNRRYVDITDNESRWELVKAHDEFWWLVGGALLVGAVRLATRRLGDVASLTLVAWLAGGAIAIVAPGPAFPHYLVTLVPAAACLLALAPLPDRAPGWASAAATALLVVALLLPFARDDVRNFDRGADGISRLLYGDDQVRRWELYKPVGDLLRGRAREGDRLYVTENEPGFYWYSGVRPASRVLYENSFRALPELRDEVQRGLCRFPPRFVVLSFEGWPTHLFCLRDRVKYREIFREHTVVVLERPKDVVELP